MLEKQGVSEYEHNNQKLRMFIFELLGPPKPEKQTMVGRGKFYNPNKLTKQQIRWQIQPLAPVELFRGPVEMHLTFYMQVPKNVSKSERTQMLNNVIRHAKRPDLSNMQYLIENSLTGVVYHDDSQICRVVHEKRWGEVPKTVIKVFEI